MLKRKNHDPFILWFSEIGKEDISKVGGKGANLGELTKAGIPVPNGFCVTAQAYYYFLEKTG
ncbi:MAG: PEP/pyruvate-binding domain-containing protein, partial [Nanoarchaeota archaeon]|nr:PEP/pyruvate-binding domain-containing protein [Nanoarchaeota archaeon]